MTNKLELKSSHEVIYTVDVADVESIFYCKPTDPDILTVLMKDGKRLYCDEVCPVDSLQEEPVSKQKLSSVERTTKNWKEPVSEKDKLRALSDGKQHLGWLDDANALEEPINKELDRFIMEHGPMATLEKCAAHFAEWGKKHSNLSISDDLDKAAKEWLIPQLDKSYANYGEGKMMELTLFDGYAMLDAIEFGANWQKDKIINHKED